MLRSGTVSVLDEDTGEFEPDFSVTAIYGSPSAAPGDWLHYEQDGFVTSVHNYLYYANGPEAARGEAGLECVVLGRDEAHLPG